MGRDIYTASMPQYKLLLVLSIVSTVASLSYNVPDGRAVTFYAVDEEPLRLTYQLPPSETRNFSILFWRVFLANGTTIELHAAGQFSHFSVTLGHRSTTLTIKSFVAAFVWDSTYRALAFFDTNPRIRESAPVTLTQGRKPTQTF